VSKDGLVLLLGPVGHLVVSKLVGRLSGVVLQNLGVFVSEVGKTEFVLLHGSVSLAMLSNVAEESSLDL